MRPVCRAAAILALLALGARVAPPSIAAEPGAAIATSGNGHGAAACNLCHGAHGEGMSAAGYPRLAHLPAPYLEAQLDEFASGARESAVMHPIAAALTSAERRAIAAYFAELKPAARSASRREPVANAHARAATLGAVLAARGHWSVGLPACDACHGPGGVGVGSRFPPLAGQPSVYIASQLHAWQMGRRARGPLGLMGAIAGRLTDADVAAVAAHYAQLGPQPAKADVASAADLGPTPGSEPRGRPAPGGSSAPDRFQPPRAGSEPDDALGNAARQGERIFRRPDLYAAAYVGNRLHCGSCHLDAGRRADSAPLWAAYVLYPAYRSKNHHVNTFAERLQGCFSYSMNGRAPPLGSPVLVALEAYSFWLARGAPTGIRLAGRGYPRLPQPPQPPDYTRGARVYEEHCRLCHGQDGAGRSSAAGDAVFPALWGGGSFNWGAGMGSIDKAAGFIEANMPFGLGGSLSLQEAWDVAQYVDSHERPQDPRFTGSVAETRARFHDSRYSMYGRRVNGRLLGMGD